jgi:predicted ribonuclease YlaK
MISAEIDAQSVRFDGLASELDFARRLFDGAGTCLVPDTSFYIQHDKKIEEVDFHQLADTTGPVRVVIPMVVIDELDGLKQATSAKVRWRAAYSVAVIDRVIADPPVPGLLRPGVQLPPRGEVKLQALLDPPGHRRMPINDDEIINRSLACRPLAGTLMVLTYDTGQSTRARAAGLKVTKFSKTLGEEPGVTDSVPNS